MNDAGRTTNEVLARLEEAASGLLVPSETDAPLTPFRWTGEAVTGVGSAAGDASAGGAVKDASASVATSGAVSGAEPSRDTILSSTGKDAATPVEAISADDFFAPFTEEREGEDPSDAKRFQALKELLSKELTDLRVLRVGSADIDVYILGRHASGEWLGLKTRVVET
jgi:hypothetical protein